MQILLWVVLFPLFAGGATVAFYAIKPETRMEEAGGDGPFSVVVRKGEGAGVGALELPGKIAPRMCIARRDIESELTGGRRGLRDSPQPEAAACSYETTADRSSAKHTRLECGFARFSYDIRGACVTPVSRKLLGTTDYLVGGGIGALITAGIVALLSARMERRRQPRPDRPLPDLPGQP